MALYPATSCIRVAIESNPTGASSLHVNVFYFARRDGLVATSADLPALWTRWANRNFAAYRGLFYTDFTINIARLSTCAPEPREKYEAVIGSTGTRTIDGDYLPEFCCAKVGWRTGYASRRWKGRTYFGGLREADNSNGVIGLAYGAAQADFLLQNDGFHESGSASEPTYVQVIMSDPDNVLPAANGTGGLRSPQGAGVVSEVSYQEIHTLRRRAAYNQP